MNTNLTTPDSPLKIHTEEESSYSVVDQVEEDQRPVKQVTFGTMLIALFCVVAAFALTIVGVGVVVMVVTLVVKGVKWLINII